MYYSDKLETLKELFGTSAVEVNSGFLVVKDQQFPIVDDVIILLDVQQYPESLRAKLNVGRRLKGNGMSGFAEDIQYTFGEEWQRFPEILPEHRQEFLQYFDMVDFDFLKTKRVCDLGCGIGRWSYFLQDKCRELILVDFSEAIFVARNNLRASQSTFFFMGDLKRLPFKNNFTDLLFCLGVLHHLPTEALEEIRQLRKYAPALLIYLYYALDNRPMIFRQLLVPVTIIRNITAKIRSSWFRLIFTWFAAIFMYCPAILLGKFLKLVRLSEYVPLYDGYNKKGILRIRQDVYDRFFTRIEQRFTRKQILELKTTFAEVKISDQLPYWHFICFNGDSDLLKKVRE